MQFAIAVILGTLLFTFGLWFGVKLVGGSPTTNKLTTAAFFGVLFAFFGALAGPFLGLLFLFALFLLLQRYYDLGIIQSILVIVIMGVFNFAAAYGVSLVASAI